MPRINVYLSEDELLFVRAKSEELGPGYVRKLIQRAMANFGSQPRSTTKAK